MNFVFLMDPIETVKMEKDTSFIFMLEAHRRGHGVFFVPDGGLTLLKGRVLSHALPVVPQRNKQRPFIVRKPTVLQEENIHAIFIRNDPPFDSQYLLNTWLLDHLSKKITVINSPHGLRTVNEKIWAAQFTNITPHTLISRNRDELLKFIRQEKNVIAKPAEGFGGKFIFYIKAGDLNTNVILETLTHTFSHEIILQQYIPDAKKGDKRILLLGGEPLGAVLRVH